MLSFKDDIARICTKNNSKGIKVRMINPDNAIKIKSNRHPIRFTKIAYCSIIDKHVAYDGSSYYESSDTINWSLISDESLIKIGKKFIRYLYDESDD